MQARTIIDRIEIDMQTGQVGVRMQKQIVDDKGAVLMSEFHRTLIEWGGDVTAQMNAVNAHLSRTGFPAVKAEDNSLLRGLMSTIADLRVTELDDTKERGSSEIGEISVDSTTFESARR